MFKFGNRQERDNFLQKLFFGTFIVGGFAWCWIDVRIFIGLLIISFVVYVINEPNLKGLESDEEKKIRRENFLEREMYWVGNNEITKEVIRKILKNSYMYEEIAADGKKEDAMKIKIFLFAFYGWAFLALIYAYFNHSSLC